MRSSTFAAIAAVGAALLAAQTPPASDEAIKVGPGVTLPRLIRKIEPEYSQDARAAGIQGSVILQIAVTEKGRAADITLVSPLGFGLDEHAQEAVAKWEFVPATKAGTPIKVLATVEVHFRLSGIWFNEKLERQRTAFNVALQTVNRPNAKLEDVDRAVRSVTDLARQKFPPAMGLAGIWKLKGEHLPKDTAEGLEWIQKSAAKSYGPALYEVAIRRIEGRDLPLDIDQGLQEMRSAAMLGANAAQFYLGVRYETGDGVPRDEERARRYFRLCAVRGIAACQYHLGQLLYNAPGRSESNYLQAVALLQLAAEQGFSQALPLASSEAAKLTAEQTASVATWKRHLIQK